MNRCRGECEGAAEEREIKGNRKEMEDTAGEGRREGAR